MKPAPEIVPDSEHRGLVGRLPQRPRDLVQLARLDRPIGAWLLFWPGAWAIALAGGVREHWPLLAWFALGAVAMRGAGCVYNDIVDRDLDARVARTRSRPVASGRVPLRIAWGWLAALCLIGLVVLLRLPGPAQAMAWLYAGSIAWVIGYDTIYALQDIEDDALAGVKSSARALGRHARMGVAGFYGAAVMLWAGAIHAVRPDGLALVALVPVTLHLGWQVAALRTGDAADALAKFRANRFAGALMFAACLVVGATA